MSEVTWSVVVHTIHERLKFSVLSMQMEQSLRLGWMRIWTEEFDSLSDYLYNLKAPNGMPMRHHSKKTFVKGFIMTSKLTKILAS